jgi:hypothetical protein
MSRAVVDLTGQVFGRLTAVERVAGQPGYRTRWRCRCECGVIKSIEPANLKSGRIRSCGCLQKEQQETGGTNLTHGMRDSSEYATWCAMKRRCRNPSESSYQYYGGRGIVVCPEWLDNFERFYADMGPRPEGTTLDRFPDKNGNYEPGNCRWATDTEQANNMRSNVLLVHDGRSLTMMEWSKETGLSYHMIRLRLRRGWTVERALTEPPAGPDYVPPPNRRGETVLTIGDRALPVGQWATEVGIRKELILQRLRLGQTPEQAIAPVSKPWGRAKALR